MIPTVLSPPTVNIFFEAKTSSKNTFERYCICIYIYYVVDIKFQTHIYTAKLSTLDIKKSIYQKVIFLKMIF